MKAKIPTRPLGLLSRIIDELAVNIRTHGIGCAVVNIRTQDLVEGRPHLLLGLISLIIKVILRIFVRIWRIDSSVIPVRIIAHTKENVVKKQDLTCDEMEAEREEDTSFEKLDKKHFVKG
ncbi:hypothetical protein OIU84_015419 [Salix udensis]|uniref:Uncharacterized protein n=1 Tax=Salix udensis TaxID=889485 RepID=A0AAD6JEB1_9ROSI|nr:hypothetical protein OIU84_015419 [Salix udensis]